MTRFPDPPTELPFSEGDQRLIDRLVDGELDEAERRDLLMRLEREPSGWRRCALGFLEAQSWSRELLGASLTDDVGDTPSSNIASSGSESNGDSPERVSRTPPVDTPIARSSGWRGWNGRATIWLSLAAGWLLAFGLGLLLRVGIIEPRGQFAQQPSEDAAVIAQDDSAASQTQRDAAGGSSPLDGVTWVVDGGNGSPPQRIHVPILPESQFDERWFEPEIPALPDDLQAELERSGHRLRAQRHFVPFQLDDGRQMLLPIDQLEILPVEQRAY